MMFTMNYATIAEQQQPFPVQRFNVHLAVLPTPGRPEQENLLILMSTNRPQPIMLHNRQTIRMNPNSAPQQQTRTTHLRHGIANK
jgi:hypothetical protein